MNNAALMVTPRDIDIRIREAWTRLPFRYGRACLTAVPIVHVRFTLESDPSGSGDRASGLSADCLPPLWFDKDPSKDFRQNVEDQLSAIRIAREVYLEAGARGGAASSLHEIWKTAQAEVVVRAATRGLNRLTASFGSSLMERAAIDAVCRLAGLSFFDALKRGVLGFPVGPEIGNAPLAELGLRHTVGLGDPLEAAEITEEERLDDGLPHALEEDITFYGLRYFKVKVCGQDEKDLDRLARIAGVLATSCQGRYYVSLDGNEQYRDPAALVQLLEKIARLPHGKAFVESIIYIEQPLDRAVALERDVESGIRELGKLKPVIIDESDDSLDSLPRALELGYHGVSVKNCKGVFKALSFRAEIFRRNQAAGEERYFQTGEDLANLPVIPLQEDLTTLAALGIDHAERNGHHYFRGLAHLPRSERESTLAAHGDLYTKRGDEVFLNITDGKLSCGSLQGVGYGYSSEIAFDERTPMDEWRFESLELPG